LQIIPPENQSAFSGSFPKSVDGQNTELVSNFCSIENFGTPVVNATKAEISSIRSDSQMVKWMEGEDEEKMKNVLE
jgi:hypothetical protein